MNTLSVGKSRSEKLSRWLIGVAFAALVWFAVYRQLTAVADWVVQTLGLSQQTHFGEAVHFFFFDTPKVLLLLTGIVFVMGIVQTYFAPERTRALLSGKRVGVGNVLAATLGIVTPFCSCSAVPLFIGLLSAGVPLGVTFSFLISAPMVNEVALTLLFARLDAPFVAVPDPNVAAGMQDRLNKAFPRLYRDGAPGYRLAYQNKTWRLYARQPGR